MTVAATIYLSLMGPQGLARVAETCHANSVDLHRRLTAIPGVEPLFTGPFFHEFAVKLARPVTTVLQRLLEQGIVGGLPLADNSLLVCATETKSQGDIESYAKAMAAIMEEGSS